MGEDDEVSCVSGHVSVLIGVELLMECVRKGSGYNFPLPRRRKPANLDLNVRLIHKFLTSSHAKPVTEARKKDGMKHRFPGLRPYNEKVTYILPATPESDFPCPLRTLSVAVQSFFLQHLSRPWTRI